jgi:hypothetical protein
LLLLNGLRWCYRFMSMEYDFVCLGNGLLTMRLEQCNCSIIMSLHYVLDVVKYSLNFFFDSLSITLEVTLASGLLLLSIDQKYHLLLEPKCISKQSERNASAWCGSCSFHIILASLPYLDNIEKACIFRIPN